MTLAELIRLFRREADDLKTPQLWSDEELIEYANDGQEQACRRAKLLLDSETASICRLGFTAGDSPVLTLSPLIIDVRRAAWVGRTIPLVPRLMARMDEEYPGWESHTAPLEPSIYVTDVQTRAIRLYRTPLVSGVVALQVFRLPLDKMTEDGDEPSIPVYAQRGLVEWMLYMAYKKQDADTFDARKSNDAYNLFVREYGEAKSARNQAWIQQEMRVFPSPLC